MRKTILPIAGFNDADHVTDDNVLQEIINYEQKQSGKIQKRVDPEEFDSALTSELTGSGKPFENGEITYIPEEPFYPNRKPSDMYSGADYMIPVYGEDSNGEYKLYFYYQDTATSWTYEHIDLEDSGIIYNESSNLIIKYIRDMALILDYDGETEPHYVKVDEDNDIVYDLLRNSVARPDRRPYTEEVTDDDIDHTKFFTSEENDSMQSPRMFQWYYTIVNKYGDEGNPSPASLPTDLLIFKEDADYTQQQYVKQITVKGMSLPADASEQMIKEAKYIRLYRQEFESDNSEYYQPPKFVADIEILNTSDEISYTDAISIVENSPVIKFDNDIAPIARDAELVGDSILLSKLKIKTSIIGLFDYIHKITINNLNTEVYPNCIIRIRLDYDISQLDDAEEGMSISNRPNMDYLLANKHLCRFFDSDLATPLPAVYRQEGGSVGEEEIEDTNFRDDEYWTTGDGWEINTSSGIMVADNATEAFWAINALSNADHIFTIKYSPSLNGLIKLWFGGDWVTIDGTLNPATGRYEFTYVGSAQGASISLTIAPVSAAVSGKVYFVSAYTIPTNPVYDVWLRVPNVLIGKKTIYFAYCSQGSVNNGVEDLTHWNGSNEYGELMDIETSAQWALQKVFTNATYRKNSYICCPLAIESSDIINVANELNNGRCNNSPESVSGNIFNIPAVENESVVTRVPNRFKIEIPLYSSDQLLFYGEVDDEFRPIDLPDRFTFYSRVRFYIADSYEYCLGEIYENSSNYIKIKLTKTNGIDILLYNSDNNETVYASNMLSGLSDGVHYYFIAVSFDKYNERITVFYQNLEDVNDFRSLQVDTTYLKDTINALQDFDSSNGCYVRYYKTVSAVATYMTGFGLEEGYFAGDSASQDGTNAAEEAALVNWASYMPVSKTSVIGYNPVCGKYRGNDISTTGNTVVIEGSNETDTFEEWDQIYINVGSNDCLRNIDSVEFTGGNTVITVDGTSLAAQSSGSYYVLIGKKHNQNVTFDTDNIEEITFQDSKNLAMFTNANGMAFPAANIKLCDQDILRIAKMPTTLAEMRNSLVMFHRNGFTRYVADGDPKTWADATNVKIPQLRRAGLIAEFSLKVTPHGIIWFSEAGIQILRGIQPEILSHGVNIPIKSTYQGYYCRNTYIDHYALHDQDFIHADDEVVSFVSNVPEGTPDYTIESDTYDFSAAGFVVGDVIIVSGSTYNDGAHVVNAVTSTYLGIDGILIAEADVTVDIRISKTWIYDFKNNSMTTFRSLDMKMAMELSGGSLVENVLLLLSQNSAINIFPDYDNASYTTALAQISKTIRDNYAEFMSIMVKHSISSGNAQLKTVINDPLNSDTETTHAFANIDNYRPYMLAIDHIGDKLEFTIKDADIIEYIILEMIKLNNPY